MAAGPQSPLKIISARLLWPQRHRSTRVQERIPRGADSHNKFCTPVQKNFVCHALPSTRHKHRTSKGAVLRWWNPTPFADFSPNSRERERETVQLQLPLPLALFNPPLLPPPAPCRATPWCSLRGCYLLASGLLLSWEFSLVVVRACVASARPPERREMAQVLSVSHPVQTHTRSLSLSLLLCCTDRCFARFGRSLASLSLSLSLSSAERSNARSDAQARRTGGGSSHARLPP